MTVICGFVECDREAVDELVFLDEWIADKFWPEATPRLDGTMPVCDRHLERVLAEQCLAARRTCER